MTQSFTTNLPGVAAKYIVQLKAPVTKTAFTKSLKENPFYPSLCSLSNTFDKFNIPNEAFRIDKENVEEMPAPFIAFMRNKSAGEDFVNVISINNDDVQYCNDGKKVITASKEDFLNDFLEIVFVAEANDKSGEQDYEQNRKTEIKNRNKNIALISSAALILLFAVLHFNYTSSNIFSSLFLSIILLAGLFVTTLLLIYDIDKTNSFVKNICTGGNEKTNCDAVLNSGASKVFGMTWSEAGFFYFTAIALFTFFTSISFAEKTSFISFAFTTAAFYIPFSIYYQYKIVKQWCPLCLATQVILAAGLIWSISDFWLNDNTHFIFSFCHFTVVIACVLLPITAWFLLKPFLLKAKDAESFEAAHKRLLYNPDIFYGLLQQQPKAADGWENLGITIGNPEAETTIIKVCNPYCGPCAKAHPVLENIIEGNEKVKLKIIFTASIDETDYRNKPVKHLLAIAEKETAAKTQQAVDDWYGADKKDYDAFAKKYPLNGEVKMQEEKIDAMKKWCDASSVIYTPTIFINGFMIPETYNIEELKNIL